MNEKEISQMIGFIAELMDSWPDGFDLDMGYLQELAIKYKILYGQKRFRPCGENCTCYEYYDMNDFENGIICYRFSRWFNDALKSREKNI